MEKEDQLMEKILDEALAETGLDKRNALLGQYLGITKAVEQRLHADLMMHECIKMMDEADSRKK